MLVIETKLVTSNYFLYELSHFELSLLLQGLNYCNKDNWEQTRLLAYITAQVNSTKKLSMQDLISFPWDNSQNEANTDTFSIEDIEALEKKTKALESLANSGKIDLQNDINE